MPTIIAVWAVVWAVVAAGVAVVGVRRGHPLSAAVWLVTIGDGSGCPPSGWPSGVGPGSRVTNAGSTARRHAERTARLLIKPSKVGPELAPTQPDWTCHGQNTYAGLAPPSILTAPHLAALHLPPHEIFDFAGTPGLRSSLTH